MSKTSQKIRSWYQLGKRDALSGKYKLKSNARPFNSLSKYSACYAYRQGFQHGLAELHQRNRKKVPTLTRKSGRIVRDILVFGSIIAAVAYVAFFK